MFKPNVLASKLVGAVSSLLAHACVKQDGTLRFGAAEAAVQPFERRTGDFCAFSHVDGRPSRGSAFITLRDYSQLAIVLQGQVGNCLSFLMETVAYYEKVYPKARIIVSTWDNEDEDSLETLCSYPGIDLVVSTPPSNCGNLNVNFQITNSLAGIRRARECGASYICKTRTDQRFQKHDYLGHLADLIGAFPPAEGLSCTGRVAVLGMTYGNLFYPFLVSDFLYFGFAEDIERVFSLPLDERISFDMPIGSTRRAWSEAELAPEVKIAKAYARSIGLPSASTVEAYWVFLRDALVCTDVQSAGLVWPKYATRFLYEESKGLAFDDDSHERLMSYNTDFQTWLGIYSGAIRYKSSYERFADVVFK